MKHIIRLAACFAALLTISSCSMLGGLAGSNATANGANTGSALLRLFQAYQVLKGNTPTGTNYNYTGTASNGYNTGIDLSNISNLLSLGQLLTGASTLTNATPNYTSQFTNGLISGSSNLVNNNNAGGVLNGLMTLANGANTSVLSAAAASAAAGNQTNVTNTTAGAAEALSTLGSIFSLLQ